MQKYLYLPKPHLLKMEDLLDGRFYIKDQLLGSTLPVPNDCAPVFCEYDWTDEGHSWKNPISGTVYTTHPLSLTEPDCFFFDGFYEITKIDEGLTFREGEAWCPDTNQKVHVEKTDPTSIWNPFFQRYDEQCNRHTEDCDPLRIEYNSETEDFHRSFNGDMTQFLNVYCRCSICQYCNRVHECFYYCKEQTGP